MTKNMTLTPVLHLPDNDPEREVVNVCRCQAGQRLEQGQHDQGGLAAERVGNHA